MQFLEDLFAKERFILLSLVEAQVSTSLTILGAWIGCLIGNKPSELKGRRFTLLWNNVFFIVGAILCSLGNLYTLFIGRFIAGNKSSIDVCLYYYFL